MVPLIVMASKGRLLIYVPKISPQNFALTFEKRGKFGRVAFSVFEIRLLERLVYPPRKLEFKLKNASTFDELVMIRLFANKCAGFHEFN